MACVYILYSKKLDRYYTGSCKDFQSRLTQHLEKVNSGFTARADDWEPFLVIEDLDYKQARAMEAHIKKMKSRTYIQNLRKYPELVDKLKRNFNDNL
jgi:putative endonuclease